MSDIKLNLVDLSENKKKIAFVRYYGRVLCIVNIRISNEKISCAFYKSSGHNAKVIDGIDYSADMIKGKWFLIHGVTENWIHKTSYPMPSLLKNVCNRIEEAYQSGIYQIGHMNSYSMELINSTSKHMPVDPLANHSKMELASYIAIANYGAFVEKLNLIKINSLQ